MVRSATASYAEFPRSRAKRRVAAVRVPYARALFRRPLVLAAALLLASCGLSAKTWSWNQKLTVEVQTPDGVRSGSAVSEVRWQERNAVGNFPGSYHGEATVVDFGQGRYLFALIGEDTRYLAMRTFEPDIGGFIDEDGFAAMASVRGLREVPRKYYPLLVTFDDIADPKTVKQVDPADLGASFGEGVSLKRITLEITDEGRTLDRIANILPCLKAGVACIPLNKGLPYGDPMRNILNARFWSNP